jgi:CubicO group peptidase (beta-lactamase class C family)
MARFDTLFERLAADVAAGVVPGLAVRIAWRGERAAWSGGYRDRGALSPLTGDTVFRLASLTKTVTSVMAVRMVESGRLDLATPLSRYFPAFGRLRVSETDPSAPGGHRLVPMVREITVHDLMRHTSGFTYGQFRDGPVEAAYRAARMADHDQTSADIIDKAGDLPLASQPGSTFEYGMSTDLLGWVLEREADKPLEDLVADLVARPLGLASMRFRPDAAGLANLAEPQPDPATGVVPILGSRNFHEARWTSAGHGLFSTVDDFMRFALMLRAGGTLDGERLLSKSMLRWMTSDHLPPGVGFGPSVDGLGGLAPLPALGQGFGLGFAVRTAPGRHFWPGTAGDFSWCGLSGTYFWADPANDLAVVLCMQAPNEREVFRSLLRRMVHAAID